MMNAKKVVLGVLGAFLLLTILYMVPKLTEDNDAGEILVIQDPIDGELHVYTQPGMVNQNFGTATRYKKSAQLWFSTPKAEGEPDQSIPVKWNDGGHATISGSVRYDLPTDEATIIKLHSTFGSQAAIENQLIKTNIEKAVYMTGPLMTSKESYAEKRNDLIFYIEDQASRGVYKTKQKEVKELDQLTGQEKTVTKVEVQIDTKNIPLRQEVSPILSYGVKLYNISINGIAYDQNVEKQIQTQQQAIMQVQTAIAKAKEAEQRAITIKAEGEANAAKAKWDQEIIKARAVTEAQQKKDVAELEVKTAELNKRKSILEGEGEAAKKRLVMQANGALEQKLEAWLRSQQYWSEAFAKYGGNVVPQIQTGGASGNGAINFMELMGVKAARELSLDMKNSK